MNTAPNRFLPRRTAPVFVRAAVAASALGVIAFHWYVQHTPPQIALPSRPPVPSANGFPLLKAAGAKLKNDDAVSDAVSASPKKTHTNAERDALVAANAPALADARAALKLPYYEANDESIMANHAYYASFRALCRAFVLSGNRAWDAGRQRDAADDYLCAITLGRRIPNHTNLLPRLVGIACENIGKRPLWKRVESMDADTAAYALRRLNALQAENLPFAATVEEEEYTMQNGVLETYRNPALLSTNVPGNDTPAIYAFFYAYKTVVPRPFVLGCVRDYMGKVAAQSRQPYCVSKAEIPQRREPISFVLTPVISHARTKTVAQIAGDNLLRTTLALRVYQLRNGKYPAALSELVAAKLLPAVPDDPFAAPHTAIRYRQTPDGKYTLYSIAPDGVDDNGRGIEGKSTSGQLSRNVSAASKGDIVAGWYSY